MGLNEKLGNKVANKKFEILNCAALWIKAAVLLHTLTQRGT